jgi:hypothetical protein
MKDGLKLLLEVFWWRLLGGFVAAGIWGWRWFAAGMAVAWVIELIDPPKGQS